MKRIGLLTMALVLALGSLGVAYAAWTDQVTIEGSVNTGSVDLEVVDYSGTWIYKTIDDHGLVNVHGWMSSPPAAPSNSMLVASALTRAGATGEADIVVTFDKVFPCQWLTADFLLHYDGSIPARLWAEAWVEQDSDQALIDNLEVEFYAWKLGEGFDPDDPAHVAQIHEYICSGEPIDLGVQVHQCEYLLVAMKIHLPQDNTLMNLDGSFGAKIQAIQWNMYEEGGGFYPYP